ncbi:MAG TPA: type II secretion system F family protein [Gemmatimonadales bacterium]|nr:type II secretion system F family protein [Gemmatimonadales bacterium]
MIGRYRYRAATAAGQMVEGVLQAPSRQTVLESLHRQRLYPVAVDEVSTGRTEGRRSRLSTRAALTLWARNSATLLGAGLPLDRALAFTSEQLGNDTVREALRRVRREVQGGASLAEALTAQPAVFDPMFGAMVSAGDATGQLETVFDRLANHLEEGNELRSQVRSALIYPALMSVVGGVGVLVLLGFVVPRFTAMLEDVGGTLPASTRLLVGASSVLTQWWWVWIPLLLASGYVLVTALKRPDVQRAWHRARLRWPWVGDLELKYATAQFTRTLGLLLRSGLPILPALRIARSTVPNVILREGVERASVSVGEGGALAPSLAETFPRLAVQMLAVGEESGRLDELCLRVSDTYDAEVRRALRTLVAMIEPAMILLFGALVGFVALAMLQAIYSMNTGGF